MCLGRLLTTLDTTLRAAVPTRSTHSSPHPQMICPASCSALSFLLSFLWPAQVVDEVGYDAAGGGANAVNPFITKSGAWLMETILTFSLVLVVFAATDKNRAINTAHLPVRIQPKR